MLDSQKKSRAFFKKKQNNPSPPPLLLLSDSQRDAAGTLLGRPASRMSHCVHHKSRDGAGRTKFIFKKVAIVLV